MFLTWSDTNRAVQSLKMARGLKLCIYEVEGLHYLCSENTGTDQFRGYCEADLRLFSHMQKAGFLTTGLICENNADLKTKLSFSIFYQVCASEMVFPGMCKILYR